MSRHSTHLQPWPAWKQTIRWTRISSVTLITPFSLRCWWQTSQVTPPAQKALDKPQEEAQSSPHSEPAGQAHSQPIRGFQYSGDFKPVCPTPRGFRTEKSSRLANQGKHCSSCSQSEKEKSQPRATWTFSPFEAEDVRGLLRQSRGDHTCSLSPDLKQTWSQETRPAPVRRGLLWDSAVSVTLSFSPTF